mgnify:CR=1 FL=1
MGLEFPFGLNWGNLSVIKIPQLSIELLNIFRNDPQGGSILKRPSLKEDTNMDQEEDEEESAYNEHFKNSGDKPGPGEFRVPSVRVRAQGPPGADLGHQQAAVVTAVGPYLAYCMYSPAQFGQWEVRRFQPPIGFCNFPFPDDWSKQ